MKTPESRLGFLAMRAHVRRLGIEQDAEGNITPRSLEKLTGPGDISPYARFEDLGLFKKKLWFGREGEGVSAERTEEAHVLAAQARSLKLEIEGLTNALETLISFAHRKAMLREEIDPHIFEQVSSLAARGINDRLAKLMERLPETIDMRSLGAIDPPAVLELTEAVTSLAGPASRYLAELSEVRRRVADADRYYTENQPGAPPARAVLYFEIKGKIHLVTLPKDMVEGSPFERQVIPGLTEPTPPIARSEDLAGITTEIGRTHWSAQKSIELLTKLSERIGAPSPLLIAERLLPGRKLETVVFLADRIEEAIEDSKKPVDAIALAFEKALAEHHDEISDEDLRALVTKTAVQAATS